MGGTSRALPAGPWLKDVAPMNESTTITLDKSEVTVFQAIEAAGHPCLILFSGQTAGRRYDLEEGTLVIGRAPDAAIRLDAVGLSRRHAELHVGQDHVHLFDLGSANRTFVNDEPVLSSVQLSEGDLIRMGNVVMRFHDRHSLDAALHDRIYRLATTDVGTGVFNRRYMQDCAKAEIARARRTQQPLSLICFDMDHFKNVNDNFGHAAGDTVLRDSAAVVRSKLRDSDILGRWGGEEFAVVLRNTNVAGAVLVADRLRAALADHVFELEVSEGDQVRQVEHRQTVSVGVAELTPAMVDEFDLLGAADQMLYAAKRAGRNRVCVATPTPDGAELSAPTRADAA